MQHRILVGLGNPGAKYAQTRHNAGFWAVDAVISALNAPQPTQAIGPCTVAKLQLDDVTVHLVQPQGYMNTSGEALRAYMAYLKLERPDIMVLADEVYLQPGGFRIRSARSHGGHNGLRSLEQQGISFAACMIGVGVYPQDAAERAQMPSLDEYVLQRMPETEQHAVKECIDRVTPDLIAWLRTGEILHTSGAVSNS
jgi:peptidyl-tRNA hydrolase, PTH1 family